MALRFRQFLTAASVVAFPHFAQAETPDILFVLDASGSMKQVTAGQTQIDAARTALRAAVAEVPGGSRVGLRVYAHRVAQSDKEASCKDSDLAVPLSADGAQKIRDLLSTVQPKGYTPIAYSLELARFDFPVATDAKKTIILLSDGEETCGGDPAAVVQKLRDEGFDVTVHVVGFNVDSKAEAQLRAVAKAGKGTYFGPKDGAALSEALKTATKEAVLIQKGQAIYGTPTRGGDRFENAVPIQTGIEYRLDHHQRGKEFDYFSLDARAGDTLTVELKTLDKGVDLRTDGTTLDTDHPYAGVSVVGPDRSQLAEEQIIGAPFVTKQFTTAARITGKQFLLVGSVYYPMHKDFVTFKVSMKQNGDLDTDRDAGDTAETSARIEPKRYKSNHLGGPDQKDVFSFEARPGNKYQIGYIPTDGFSATVQMRVFDEYKSPVTDGVFRPTEGGKLPPFEVAEAGVYFLELSLPYGEQIVGEFLLELKQLPVESPTQQPTPAPVDGSTP